MDRLYMRYAALSCVFACGTMVVGPGVVGTAVANAGLLGIDLFGDDHKSHLNHPRPGSTEPAVQASRSAVAAAEPSASAPVGPAAPVSTFAGVPKTPGNVASVAGLGGGIPRSIPAGRSTNLPRVPTVPVTRSVVIRGTPRASGQTSSELPGNVPPAVPQSPGTAPLATPPPAPPRAKGSLAPKDSRRPGRVPDGFRIGYAEYLRSATTSDLFVAALPGVAGIAGFTVVGAYAGYRQARSLRAALLPPAATRVLL